MGTLLKSRDIGSNDVLTPLHKPDILNGMKQDGTTLLPELGPILIFRNSCQAAKCSNKSKSRVSLWV